MSRYIIVARHPKRTIAAVAIDRGASGVSLPRLVHVECAKVWKDRDKAETLAAKLRDNPPSQQWDGCELTVELAGSEAESED